MSKVETLACRLSFVFYHQYREVDKYLSASGYLPPNVKPFFVALPKDRQITGSAEWRAAIQTTDKGVIQHLQNNITGGFDEARYGDRVGFGALKHFLEDELAMRYRDAAPATLTLLQKRCELVAADLVAADKKLAAASDVVSLKRAGDETLTAPLMLHGLQN